MCERNTTLSPLHPVPRRTHSHCLRRQNGKLTPPRLSVKRQARNRVLARRDTVDLLNFLHQQEAVRVDERCAVGVDRATHCCLSGSIARRAWTSVGIEPCLLQYSYDLFHPEALLLHDPTLCLYRLCFGRKLTSLLVQQSQGRSLAYVYISASNIDLYPPTASTVVSLECKIAATVAPGKVTVNSPSIYINLHCCIVMFPLNPQEHSPPPQR